MHPARAERARAESADETCGESEERGARRANEE